MYEVTTASAPSITSARVPPRRPSVSETVTTFRSGANRCASAAQLASTEVGATMRKGWIGRSRRLRSPDVLRVLEQRQGLQRLAEPHVVGQDAAEPVRPQEREPLEPGQLVGPQLRVDRGGHRHRRRSRSTASSPRTWRCHAAAWWPTTPSAASSSHRPAWNRLIRSAAVRLVLQRAGLVDEPGERGELRLVQGEVRAVGEQQVRLAVRERDEQVGERHLAALDGDRDAEVEPVALAVALAGGQADLQRVARPRGSRAPGRSPRRARRRGPDSSGSTSVVNAMVSRPRRVTRGLLPAVARADCGPSASRRWLPA